MKVIGPGGTPLVPPDIGPGTKSSAEPSEFKKIMQKAVADTPSGNSPSKSTQRLMEPQAAPLFTDVSPATSILNKAKGVIDLMEHYAESLADPGKSIKEIEPVLNSFVTESKAIHEEYTQNEKTSGELTKILEDLRRAAQLERIRFRRGDYVDTD